MPLTKIDDRGLTTPVDLLDNERIRLGTGNDLQIYHNGSNSYIDDAAGTGALIFKSNFYSFRNAPDNATIAQFSQGGAVELYYNNSKKFETTSAGAEVSGTLRTGNGSTISFSDNVNLEDSTGSGNNRIKLGAGDDLQIYHDGSHSFIEDAGTGQLKLLSNQFRVHNQADTETMLAAFQEGGVKLMYDNVLKFETTSTGVLVNGDLTFGNASSYDIQLQGGKIYGDDNAVNTLELRSTSGNPNHARIAIGEITNYDNGGIVFYGASNSNADKKLTIRGNTDTVEIPDNHKYVCGDGSDLQIYHNGSHSIAKNSTGDFYLAGDSVKLVNAAINEDMLVATANGAVDLYYNNSKKIETRSDGAAVTGVFSVSSNLRISGELDLGTANGNKFMDVCLGDNYGFYLRSTSGEGLAHETLARFHRNGNVELNHDGNKKFETTSYGSRTSGYHTQSTAIGFQGDAADWTSSTRYMHNMSIQWTSGHFVNSTGTFTCPVAGKYLCSATVQAHRANNPSGSSGTYFNVIWQKNNSNYHVEAVGTVATDASALSTSAVNGKHGTVTATVIMDCAANDTIRAYSNHGYRHNTQNICSVYLLG